MTPDGVPFARSASTMCRQSLSSGQDCTAT